MQDVHVIAMVKAAFSKKKKKKTFHLRIGLQA
jgi:hypothetical protein